MDGVVAVVEEDDELETGLLNILKLRLCSLTVQLPQHAVVSTVGPLRLPTFQLPPEEHPVCLTDWASRASHFLPQPGTSQW